MRPAKGTLRENSIKAVWSKFLFVGRIQNKEERSKTRKLRKQSQIASEKDVHTLSREFTEPVAVHDDRHDCRNCDDGDDATAATVTLTTATTQFGKTHPTSLRLLSLQRRQLTAPRLMSRASGLVLNVCVCVCVFKYLCSVFLCVVLCDKSNPCSTNHPCLPPRGYTYVSILQYLFWLEFVPPLSSRANYREN